jgi:acyl-CoA synthetase (AMP-forming)/AMP-acid ligase II
LRIVDERGSALPDGEVGRVALRSGAVMRGYWRKPDRPPGPEGRSLEDVVDPVGTRSVLAPDGWLTTGDFGRVGPDGNLTLVGRDNELYIRGGYNVFPAEVEGVLAEHPGIRQVAVIGAPDPVLGEVGVAFIVADDGTAPPALEEVRLHCRLALADYKAPDALVVVDALPLTPMMKVDRRPLLQQAEAAARTRPLGKGRSAR